MSILRLLIIEEMGRALDLEMHRLMSRDSGSSSSRPPDEILEDDVPLVTCL